MKKLVLVCGICFCVLTSMTPFSVNSDEKKFASLLPAAADEGSGVAQWIDSIYNFLELENAGLKKNIFFYACKGYQYFLSQGQLKNPGLLTICDYSQSSTKKRLYVIDMQKGVLLFNTYVSHGKNSGNEYATSFSNRADSHKSSLGFMITGDTYSGRAGYSMHFNGMENGINNNVRTRAIVMHGSNYVNAQRADEGNAMGRSYGCPAVPYKEHKDIINTIKNGSCFFAYAEDKWYASTSQVLKSNFVWPSVTPIISFPSVQTANVPPPAEIITAKTLAGR